MLMENVDSLVACIGSLTRRPEMGESLGCLFEHLTKTGHQLSLGFWLPPIIQQIVTVTLKLVAERRNLTSVVILPILFMAPDSFSLLNQINFEISA